MAVSDWSFKAPEHTTFRRAPPSIFGSSATSPAGSAFTGVAENFYVEVGDPKSVPYTAKQAEAYFSTPSKNFYIRKKRPDEEISVKRLSPQAQKLFLGPGGSREKEWKSVQTSGGAGEPAVRIFRGAAARQIRKDYADRILPSRWHEKWKDMGDAFENQLPMFVRSTGLFKKEVG